SLLVRVYGARVREAYSLADEPRADHEKRVYNVPGSVSWAQSLSNLKETRWRRKNLRRSRLRSRLRKPRRRVPGNRRARRARSAPSTKLRDRRKRRPARL